MASLRIKVGASLDPGALKVFEPLEKAGERARANIARTLNAASASGAAATRPISSSWNKLEKELEADAKKIQKTQERAFKQAESEFQKSERAKTRAAETEAKRRESIVRTSSEMAGRYAAQQANKEIREAKRAADAASKIKPWYARDLIGGSGGAIGIGKRAGIRVNRGAAALYGYGGAAVSGALGIGSDIIQGLGVDTSFASMVGKSQEQQGLATKISNAGYVPGTQLQDPRDILRSARAVGNETGTDTTEVLSGLRAFVGKTGDLKTGQDILGDMARLSRATGTNLEDMANAAAEVTNNIGDVPDKANVVNTVMKQIAGQGKLGAVEIRDLATQMAKLAVNARKFEGGTAANIAELGIIAQEAKLSGGATSATQAGTTVASFAGDVTKRTTLKHWAAAGLSPFADKAQTQIRSPEELILEAVKYSKGNIPKLNDLFPNKMSGRAVQGFAGIYSNAQGGEVEKLAAVTAEFDRLRQAQLDDAEVSRAFAASMKTSEAQVTVFNNHMTEVSESLAGAIIPAFEGLAPKIVDTATSFANMIANWTGQNRQNAVDALDALPVGTADKDRALLNRTSQVGASWDPATGVAGGHRTTVYSAEELEVIKQHGVKRGAAMASLQTQIGVEGEKANDFDTAARLAVLPSQRKELSDKAQGYREQAAQDSLKLAAMTVEQGQTNDILRTVYTAVQQGSADIVAALKQAPAGGGNGPGTTDGNSPNPD